jgi:hypothetical protein
VHPGKFGLQHPEPVLAIHARLPQSRANLLLSDDPDRSRLDRRFGFWNSTDSSFNAAQDNTQGQSNLGGPGRARLQPGIDPYGLQLWSEVHASRFNDDISGGDRRGDFEVLYVGGDLMISRSILIGALVQFDWMHDSSTTLNGDIDGRGWMAGPYVGIRLGPNWQFDARAAWGQSNNDITIGSDTGSFDTDRWLTRGSLRGNWYTGPWRFTSISELAYIEEHQRQYTVASGDIIPNQTVALGRFSFGPEVAYRFKTGVNSFIEPQLSFLGQWNFDHVNDIVLDGIAASPDAVTGQVEAAVMFGFADGITFRAAGAYEGVGSGDFSAWSLRLWGSVPLSSP